MQFGWKYAAPLYSTKPPSRVLDGRVWVAGRFIASIVLFGKDMYARPVKKAH